MFNYEKFEKLYSERQYTAPLRENPERNRILVVTQCTGSKASGPHTAVNKYTGGQAAWIKKAKQGHPIDVLTLSAGYGWVQEPEIINDYNITFNDLTKKETRAFGAKYRLREELEELIAGAGYMLIIIALGNSYLEAIEPRKPFNFGDAKVKIFCNKDGVENLEGDNVQLLSHKARWPRQYGAGIIALKGRIIHHMLGKYSPLELIERDDIWENI